jgi:hypothetical protein
MFEAIVVRERTLGALLDQHPLNTPPSAALISAAKEWSEAVWDTSQGRPSSVLNDDEVERGIALSHRPVFVCGAHRSGTTLVRDLLDGHPSLSVLPSEGTFFTSLRGQRLHRSPDERLASFAVEWLRRLANPINRPPYWLLGRSTADASSYVEFADILRAWWVISQRRLAPDTSAWPLVAVSLAFAHTTRGLRSAGEPSRWVEKTPGNERFARLIVKEFPGARIIHVVRHPLSVLASRKRLELLARGSFWRRGSVLRELAASYRAALKHTTGSLAVHYCIVRYEELIEDPPKVTDRIARFLDIEPLPVLLRPTVAGIPSVTNSAFNNEGRAGLIAPAAQSEVLSRSERMLAAVWVGRVAEGLGYRLK